MTPEELKTQVIDALAERGIPASAQRVAILRHLKKSRCHPSVDDVYEAVSPSIPTLSKTTVYSTLRLFCQKGLASAVPTDDGRQMRFDGVVSPHPHFICSECGKIFDLECDPGRIVLPANLPEGFVCDACRVVYSGTCASCARKDSNS